MATKTNETIRWLHISDLHLGKKGQELWWQVDHEFRDSVKKMLKRVGGMPHLLFITGDLAFGAKKGEYDRFVVPFLDALVKQLVAESLGISFDEAATLLDRSPRQVRHLNEHGELPARESGARLCYPCVSRYQAGGVGVDVAAMER